MAGNKMGVTSYRSVYIRRQREGKIGVFIMLLLYRMNFSAAGFRELSMTIDFTFCCMRIQKVMECVLHT